jgi:hypothetical protein
MKRLLTLTTIFCLSLIPSGLLLAQSNPFVGTWKLNIAKSKYVNLRAPKSETRATEAQVDAAKTSYGGVAWDGSRIGWSYTAKYDGKDNPISGTGSPNQADTVALKRIDANTYTSTLRKAGKVVWTSRTVASDDGKVMTITSKGTNQQGQPDSSTSVWDKQ